MKFILSLILMMNLNVFAEGGDRVGNGTSEGPWVQSQDVFKKVLNYADRKMLPVISMEFLNPNTDTAEVVVKVKCGDEPVTLIFNVTQKCREGSRIPGLCIPSRSVTLDESRSDVCKRD